MKVYEVTVIVAVEVADDLQPMTGPSGQIIGFTDGEREFKVRPTVETYHRSTDESADGFSPGVEIVVINSVEIVDITKAD